MKTSEQTAPKLLSRDAGEACKLCGNKEGIWRIHYPEFVFRSGDFEAPPWFAHDKFYCPACRFLWAGVFEELDTAAYGRKYVENNYDHQRRPTEGRMAFAPLLISRLVKLAGGTRFLDYGCGYNYTYIYELRSRGIDLWGCDISAAVNYSRYLVQLPFEDFTDASFDGIYSIDVMEHISDLEGDFRNMARILKPGSFMLHNTIRLENYWKGEDEPPDDPMVWAPWHCSIFSEESGRILASRVGLEFKGVISVKSDTGVAFLFRKPGTPPPGRNNWLGRRRILRKLSEYREYFRRNYTAAARLTVSGGQKTPAEGEGP